MNKFIYVWLAVKTIFSSCSYDQGASGIEKVGSQYKINKIGKLPSIVSESSGISLASDSISYWTHNDSGGGPTLYHISAKGLLIGTKHFPESFLQIFFLKLLKFRQIIF